MIAMHDIVVVTEAVPGTDLQAGDMGIVVEIYNIGEAYEVEFFDSDSVTVATETLFAGELRPVPSTYNLPGRKTEATFSAVFSDWFKADQN